MLSCEDQLEEFRRVTHYPRIRERLKPAIAGRLVNEIRSVATILIPRQDVTICKDPWDNYLLGLVETGEANFLVTGDKADLLIMRRHKSAEIITARTLLARLV